MVLRQVGKGRHIKVDAAHPLQCQSVAGRLHHHMGTASRAHPGEQGLQLQALRGGALRGDDLIAYHVGHGADQAHLRPQDLFQHLLQKQRGGGFAVGAGDADHGHGFCRMAVEVTPHQRQGQPVRGHPHIGDLPLRLLRGNHRRRAFFQGHGDKAVAIGSKTGHSHKQSSRCNLPGVVIHIADLRFQISGTFQNRYVLQKRFQFHR